jgi:hypothetical protein
MSNTSVAYSSGEYASGAKHTDVIELLMEWGVQAELLLGAAARQAAGMGQTCYCQALNLTPCVESNPMLHDMQETGRQPPARRQRRLLAAEADLRGREAAGC